MLLIFHIQEQRNFWKNQWHDRMDAGFDGTMVDFGEIIPDEAVFYDGRTGDEMHNAYALDYTKAYRKLFVKI